MDTNKLRKVQIASIFIMVSFFVTSVLTATGGVLTPQVVTQSRTQIVGVFGDQSNSAINLGMEAYLNTIDKDFEVLSFNQIQQFKGQVVIFAHGDENEVRLSESLIFTWDDFSFLLSSAKAEKIILASCFGANTITDRYSGPELISWNGYVDALLIGYAAAYHTLQEGGNNIDLVLNQIFRRATLLASEQDEPVYLAGVPGDDGGDGGLAPSESGYASAYRMQYTGSGASSGRIIWFNFDEETGDYKISRMGFGVLSFYGSNYALICTIIPAPILLLILAVLIVNAVLMEISSANRIRHDYMIGVQFFKFIPLINFAYHNGNDGYKLSGIFYFPYIAAGGIAAYFGVANVPTYKWTAF